MVLCGGGYILAGGGYCWMVGGGIVFIGFKADKSETHGTYKSFPLNLKDGLRINCLLNDFSRRVENTPDGLLYI